MDWNDFAKRLTLELSRLPVGSFLIVQDASGLPYVQAMRSEGALDAEAVGNAFLSPPLAPHQERRLSTLGWEPPDGDERRNWWRRRPLRDRASRASGENLESCALLAGLMVGAFRDVYGVDSPRGLVYQAERIGAKGGVRGGPITLPGLGLPLASAEGDAPAEQRAPQPSAYSLETALTEAREQGDQRRYLEILTDAVLYLPALDAPKDDRRFATARFGEGTFVLAFTSPEAMDRSLQGQAVHHRQVSLAELTEGWPHPGWRLAVNAGLPSASYLDADAISNPGDRVPASAAAAVPAPRPPGDGRAGRSWIRRRRPRARVPEAAATAQPSEGLRRPPDAEEAAEAAECPRSVAGPSRSAESRGAADAAADPPPSPAESDHAPLAADGEVVIVQKVLREEHVRHYLEGGFDLVAGHVHRLQDVRELTTPEALVRGLGLLYDGSPFTPADESVFVIRWAAVRPSLFRASGHAPGEATPIPEFETASQRLPHGAELLRIDASGTASLVAVYDADLRTWPVRSPGERA
ncbi:SseB family protein [Actinomadura sp. NEAU-AAG7]|uniref:SseB family protein n=1 Tax=Actinomadura sp. NEAU-AAG7 TaxID=2839640 RepID=UPI001BE4B8DE|nr:SseB family protein [Actinomadura sp. NEAU-AAG7]MBT2210996.1 SseB family protein [Actinomadura sp. NEAU-AAG7]